MYENFYGLTGKPFSLLPDAGSLFLSKHHRRVMNLLEYGVVSEAGFIVVTGEIGAGKTTIMRSFLKNTGPQVVVGVITNPSPTLGRLLSWIANAFDLGDRSSDDTTLYNNFIDFLIARYGEGKRAILIIDEAQNLPAATLEELRMLSNVNNERDLLLQIVLVGQPELLETLKRPDLRQFAQRIAVHYHLGPLPPAETLAYIRYRLQRVGGTAEIFDNTACAAVHHFTGGVPRLINMLCDQSLVYGYSEDRQRITYETVAEVAIDRSRYGLSAFCNVPEVFSARQFLTDIQLALDEIRRARRPARVRA